LVATPGRVVAAAWEMAVADLALATTPPCLAPRVVTAQSNAAQEKVSDGSSNLNVERGSSSHPHAERRLCDQRQQARSGREVRGVRALGRLALETRGENKP